MEDKKEKYANSIVDDNKDWYAIRLYTVKLEDADTFFTENGIETFIPKQYVAEESKQGKVHNKLKPVVRNIIFVKKTMEEACFKRLVYEADIKMSVYTKPDNSNEYYTIPHEQMYEFRLMCNPEIEFRKFIPTEEARLKAGDEVFVKYGPLRGMKGRLVRSSKKYYLLKEIPGISIMLKVSRWCCVPTNEMYK